MVWSSPKFYPEYKNSKSNYPATDEKSYRVAQKALQKEEEQIFKESEVDSILPNGIDKWFIETEGMPIIHNREMLMYYVSESWMDEG